MHTCGPTSGVGYGGLVAQFPFCVCASVRAQVREVHEDDELGMTPKQHAASSIIHLANKLINSVNEEEQRRQKLWAKSHLVAGSVARDALISEVRHHDD